MVEIIRKQIAYNTSKRTSPISYIIIHDTGNTKVGTNASSHYTYFNTADRQSSADFFVDDKVIYCVNDYINRYTWAVGDGAGKYGITNNNSISIELCVNSDGNYEVAFANMVELVKQLIKELNLPIDKVRRHYDASHKNCPASMSLNNWDKWNLFKIKLILQEEVKVISINVNGEKTDIEGKIIDGSTYVPLRKLCDKLGYIVDWYENTQVANIVTSTIIPKKVEDAPFKYYTKNGCHIVEISPSKFGVNIQNKTKNEIDVSNFFNLAYFAKEDNGDLINLGNLADSGVVLGQSKNFPSWVGLYNKTLTTLVVKNDNSCSFIKTNDLSIVKDLKIAVSGIPILLNGQEVSLSKDIIVEGYDTSPFRFTWHGFLTYQNGKIIYIMAQTGDDKSPANATTVMANLLKGLGMTGTVLKEDGGGSAILRINGKTIIATSENRKICSIGMFE